MKKFIAIALLLAMCLGLFAGCNFNGGEDTTPSTVPADNLESAKDYLRAMYKDKAGKVLRSFDVVGVVTIEGTAYTVEWTTDASEEYIKIVPADKLVTIEVVNAKPTEQIDFTLTATVSDAEGKTASTTLKYYIEAVEPEEVSTVFVDAPVAGTAYKYALVQATLGKTLYFTGEMDGYYLAMSENAAEGVDVVLEEAEGGYYISFTKDGAKKYIDIIPREGSEGKVNVVIADAPTAVYAWDTERKTMTTTVEGNPWYLGTYGEYTTISASSTSYIEDVTKIGVSQFPAGFVTVGGSSAPVTPDAGDKEPEATEPEATEPEATEPEATEPAAPSVEVTDGQKVVIYNPGDAMYATGTEYLYTSSKGTQKNELELTADKASAVVLTIKVGSNGNISFVNADGKYLFCDGTNVQFVAEAGEFTEFVLESAEGGVYIRCATANYQGKPQYIEIYSGYLTCYGMGTNTALYVFELQAA